MSFKDCCLAVFCAFLASFLSLQVALFQLLLHFDIVMEKMVDVTMFYAAMKLLYNQLVAGLRKTGYTLLLLECQEQVT